jgi:hypothetical protein
LTYLFSDEASKGWANDTPADTLFSDGPDKEVDIVNLEFCNLRFVICDFD